MAQKKVKKKVNKKALIVILLTLYLIIMLFYCAFKLPIKNIVVIGNTNVSDNEIIKASGLDNYPRLFKFSSRKIANNVMAINELKNVKVKKNLLGKVTIVVDELDVLFYNSLNNTYVLSDTSEVKDVYNKLGVPTLVNYVQNDIYSNLIEKMSNTNKEVISLISEIEYYPKIVDGKTTFEDRFLLRMNDGNYVIISLPSFENVNSYPEMFATINEKGVISGNKAMSFKSFDLINKQGLEGSDENELP